MDSISISIMTSQILSFNNYPSGNLEISDIINARYGSINPQSNQQSSSERICTNQHPECLISYGFFSPSFSLRPDTNYNKVAHEKKWLSLSLILFCHAIRPIRLEFVNFSRGGNKIRLWPMQDFALSQDFLERIKNWEKSESRFHIRYLWVFFRWGIF